MEDDLAFGTSVWGSHESPKAFLPSKPSISLSMGTPPLVTDSELEDSGFDDFEDFNTAPTSAVEATGEFGEFEEFGEAMLMTSQFEDQDLRSGPLHDWQPLRLDPTPESSELEREIQIILEPIWAKENTAGVMTDEGIREMDGIAQILTTSEGRELYKLLLQTPPPIKPPNWTRSRIRRQHLITLGIPINLDELLPRVNGTPLPPLEINTRPSSTPPLARNSISPHLSRSSTPQHTGVKSSAGSQFGPKPELNMDKIKTLLELDTETLIIQPLATLERHLADFKMHTANTSNLLTYLLQTKDALQQDSETYNGLIAELVGEAQKMKSGKPRIVGNRRSGVV